MRQADLSFRRAEDVQRKTRLRLDGLDRQAATGRVLSYQPTITSTGTAPVVQPADVEGSYFRHNDLVIAKVSLIVAGAFSAGTGDWLISLPVAIDALQFADGHQGTWLANIGGTETEGTVRSYSADRTKVKCSYLSAYPSGTRRNVGAGFPGTWGAASELHLTVVGFVGT